jgi:hypothetical protein
LQRTGYSETAERLLLHRLSIPPRGALHPGTILIVGTARIGKSTVAREVARALRMRVLSTDDLEPRRRTNAATCQLLVQICRTASGLVLEGKALTLHDRSDGKRAGPRLAFHPDVMRNAKLHVFALGCCTSSPENWESVLRHHGGWLTARGEEYTRRFARRIGERNRRLRDLTLAAGVEYFEIPREDFVSAVDRTVDAIVARVQG